MRTFKLYKFTVDNDISAKGRLYLDYLKLIKQAPSYTQSISRYLGIFFTWLDERGIGDPKEVTPKILEHYRRHVGFLKKGNKKPLSAKTQGQYLMAIRCFFRWMAHTQYIPFNPAAELKLPRVYASLPKDILTPSEAETILSCPNIRTPLGLRDRVILELFYATGIRRKEMAYLKLSDLDLQRGTLLVREAKNHQDRMVPMGERAQAWLEKYLREVRPDMVMDPDEGYVFINREGRGIDADYLSQRVGEYVVASGVEKEGSCHMFRHTMATLMLEGGADIRYVQEMLGHITLQATQIYTKVAIGKLQEIHAKTHPGATLKESDDPQDS